MSKITGEYWYDPSADILQYCDGDVGDWNHEGVVIETAQGLLMSEFGADYNSEKEFDKQLEKALRNEGFFETEDDDYAAAFIRWLESVPERREELSELHTVAVGQNADASFYAARKWGWMSVHHTNIGCYKWDRKAVKACIEAVMAEEDPFGEDLPEEAISWTIRVNNPSATYTYSYTLKELEDEIVKREELAANGSQAAQIEAMDKNIRNPVYRTGSE